MMRVSKDGQAVFPKITVCLNSMHSKQYLTVHYPDLEVGCFSSIKIFEHFSIMIWHFRTLRLLVKELIMNFAIPIKNTLSGKVVFGNVSA